MQTAVQHMDSTLRDMKDPTSKAAHEKLLQSTKEASSLILSLIMCNPSRLPQFSRLNMADGSMCNQQGPVNAAAILVSVSAS